MLFFLEFHKNALIIKFYGRYFETEDYTILKLFHHLHYGRLQYTCMLNLMTIPFFGF